MILYYAELPGGERLFVDPVNDKLEIIDEFKFSYARLENLGTDAAWRTEFQNHVDSFLSWAKERIHLFSKESGECGCYLFNNSELHLIKENIPVEGEHQSCILLNGEKVDEPVNGTGVLEQWDDAGKLLVKKIGTFKNSMLQGPGEKYDFNDSPYSDIPFFYRGEFKDDLLNGSGRTINCTIYEEPILFNEKILYFIPNWAKYCLNPATSYTDIISPLENNDRTFTYFACGNFKNNVLDGKGYVFGGYFEEVTYLEVGDFFEGHLEHGLDVTYREPEMIISIGKFTFTEEDYQPICNGICERSLIIPFRDSFRFFDLVPLLKGDLTLREFMLNNLNFSSEWYEQGNIIEDQKNGDGIEILYGPGGYELFENGNIKTYESSIYTGSFLYDMKHGKGLLEKTNEWKYNGEFFADRFHGMGKLLHYVTKWEPEDKKLDIWCDEVKIGSFVCGTAHGHIHTTRFFRDGEDEDFDGTYEVDKMEGTHDSRFYENITYEDKLAILDITNIDPIPLPAEKMVESKKIEFLHGRVIED